MEDNRYALKMEYIKPFIKKYLNVDDLLQGSELSRPFYGDGIDLSVRDLLNMEFVCIVGEPGVGKSRLIKEMRDQIPDKYHFIDARDFVLDSTANGKEYYIIDALDEVPENQFFHKLQSIRDLKQANPTLKIVFSCRKHYVASYVNHFASIKGISFIEISKLTNEQVDKAIENCSSATKDSVSRNPKLKALLRIPRYLCFMLQGEQQGCSFRDVGALFDYIITRAIENAIEQSKSQLNSDTFIVLIMHALEKIALIMEISRKDQISKDELYSILDGVKGNMTQMLLANFDLLFFKSRILKETNGILQFENTELQEYLAAKELVRHDHIESILYDVAVHKELKHVYPNWYDVLPHISYSENGADTLINIIKLIISYESNLEDKSFEALLRYVDPNNLSLQQKKEFFTLILDHYFRDHPDVYIGSQIVEMIASCYNSACDAELLQDYNVLNKIQLTNIRAILERLREDGKLDDAFFNHWKEAAKVLISRDDEDYKLIALNIFFAINDVESLIQLIKDFNSFSDNVKETYYDVTGYSKITEPDVVDCWLEGCFQGNPHAINAVMYATDVPTIIYSYNRIIEAGKSHEFFNPKGSLVVFYEFSIARHYDLVWNNGDECRRVISQVIAAYLSERSYAADKQLYPLVKNILSSKETGCVFLRSFESPWYIENLFNRFDAKLIDSGMIAALDELMRECGISQRRIDSIIELLVYRIKDDPIKKYSIANYIERYTDTFNSWDKNAEIFNRRSENPELIKCYKSLKKSGLDKYIKFEAAFNLSQHIEFVETVDLQPIVDTIILFFNEINLDEEHIKQGSGNTFSISLSLVKIPSFVKLLSHFGKEDVLSRYRDILLKTLPIICWASNLGFNEANDAYKSVIGTITKEEQDRLVDWFKSRKDDFINISPDDVIKCITDYGIDALSYKLEEYVNAYVDNQDSLHRISAAKALTLISEGYCNWNVNNYRLLFDRLTEDGIDSIKMQCNAIMIEEYQDAEAIKWRIDYLKSNVFKSNLSHTGHVRSISLQEIEVTKSNPSMFRCFMSIKDNEYLIGRMLELFQFALSLSVNKDTHEYSGYLLSQIYLFFITTGNLSHISGLRKAIENHNTANPCYYINRIMNNAETIFLNRNQTSIEKAVKQYNRCIEASYLDIRNDGDLRRYFTNIYLEVQKEIQDQGIYSLVRSEDLSEDFIQRELKNTIINICCRMGLEPVQIDREVTLQDNKRTDLLIRFGLCNPIMIELKLLHNDEIQNDNKRREYKRKFMQYINATNASLSVFWVFDVHRKQNNSIDKFDKLKAEYHDLQHTRVILSDCKCSSGFETGIPKPRKSKNHSIPRKSKNTK